MSKFIDSCCWCINVLHFQKIQTEIWFSWSAWEIKTLATKRIKTTQLRTNFWFASVSWIILLNSISTWRVCLHSSSLADGAFWTLRALNYELSSNELNKYLYLASRVLKVTITASTLATMKRRIHLLCFSEYISASFLMRNTWSAYWGTSFCNATSTFFCYYRIHFHLWFSSNLHPFFLFWDVCYYNW